MLTLGSPAHTLIYYLPASELIGVTVLNPTEVSPRRTYYTVSDFLAAISPSPDAETLALVEPEASAAA